MDSLSEPQGSAATSLHQFRDAVKKGKEKVIEEGSAWVAGPPKLGGGSPDARGCPMEIDGDPWRAHVGKAGDAGNGGAGCWGDWDDQVQLDRNKFQGTNGQQGRFHNVWNDRWKGILGAKPADPVNTPWPSWDTGMRGNEADMSAQESQATGEVSRCDDILMEDSSSSWLWKVKDLHFPIPDEHQLRARQIELDEEFARKLQEQLNQGLQGSQQSESVDTAIAWTLQEQDAEHARIVAAAREGQSSSRMAVLDSIREALESFGDPYSRDSDDEYENVIVHDNNNNNNDHRGASDDQINNLPVSVVEVENPDDLCPICWDCPVAGDSLPAFAMLAQVSQRVH
ncbi:hypothetical protein PR202_ga10172 [Eleusine coracana subsp. coracana]|uniref:Uncharacterized protein n=1 Tax=Eleusine coracana subsp. coracana TaxID=191504 RepID=A0AAV5C628_ELECO|nr:hypothetical protein PR202_ga10172 [Eleusine coracana subsp. coracana]